MRFVVVLLIGSGWTLLKPFLNDREKKIVLVVLALQVLKYRLGLLRVDEWGTGSFGPSLH